MRALLDAMVRLAGRSVWAKAVSAEPEYWNMREKDLRSLTRWVGILAATACILVQGERPCMAEPTVYAGTWNGALHSIEVATGTENWVTGDKQGIVVGVAAARDVPVVVFVTSKVLCLYNSDGDMLWCQEPGTQVSASVIESTPVAISDDGEHIVVARYDAAPKTVDLLDHDGQLIWSYGFDVESVAITADGKHIVAGGGDGVAYWEAAGESWVPADANPIWATGSTGYDTLTVAITRNTSNLHMVAGGRDGQAHLFAPGSATPIWSRQSGSGSNGIHMSVDINPQGDRAAACNHDENQSGGAELDVFQDTTDGSSGWSGLDGTPAWTYRPGGTNMDWDCRALDFEMLNRGQLLMSAGHYWQLYKQDADGAS